MTFDFDTLIDRTLFSSTKWTYPNDPLYTRHQPTPLWVADMDFQSPPSVRKALLDVINYGVLGYTNCPESTFEAIVDWQKIRHLWDIQTDWIIQSPGVVTAIDIMINALTEPNDAIIINATEPPAPLFQIKGLIGLECFWLIYQLILL